MANPLLEKLQRDGITLDSSEQLPEKKQGALQDEVGAQEEKQEQVESVQEEVQEQLQDIELPQASTDELRKSIQEEMAASKDEDPDLEEHDQGEDEVTQDEGEDRTEQDSGIPDFDSMFKERTQGKFDSFENFEKFLETAEEKLTAKPQELHPDVAKLQEYVENGGNVADYLNVALKDYNAVDDGQLVKEFYAERYPTLDSEEVNYLIGKNLNSKDENGELTMESRIALKTTLIEAKEHFAKKQENFSFGLEQNTSNSAEVAERQEEAQRLQEDYMKKLDSYLTLNTEKKFKAGSVDIDFKYSVEDKELINKVSENPNAIFERWVSDGEVDFNKLTTDLMVLQNYQKLLGIAHDLGKSSGTGEILGKMKDPKPVTKSKKGNIPSISQQLASQHPLLRRMKK